MMIQRRRMVLSTAAFIPLLATRAADADTTDLVVMCDLTLGPALAVAAAAFRARTGVRVDLFPTAPGLIVPQLSHNVQNDIVVTQPNVLEQAQLAGLLATAAKSSAWSDAVVVAEATDASGPPGSGKFAMSDLPSASGIDAATALRLLDVEPPRIVSAIDTTEVAFLLASGAARVGLLYLTDVRADPRLRVLRTVEGQPPAVYNAAVTKGTRRPDPSAFMAFLETSDARALLTGSGLEIKA